MLKTIGFVGCGNMARAMISGITASGLYRPENIIASHLNTKVIDNTKQEIRIRKANDNKQVAKEADLLVLAVKPFLYSNVIQEIADSVNSNTIVMSIAPGITLQQLREWFQREVKIIRAMPNSPALVREGMTAICANDLVSDDECSIVCTLLNSFGKTQIVSENFMDAVVAVSGSSPAYIYILIEAMADAAVKEGMPRDQAYVFAAQSVYGSAKMVLETGLHPGVLKDQVCSPGGAAIKAVSVLEETGFRGSIIKAMKACTQ